ncbi:MAG: alpha-amylase family glycosyl hydrolase [Acidimicrobiia bacterium]
MATDPNAWWREGALYQLYPRSYADTTGDGVGDLRGLIGKLDHLQWLGVDGFWTCPITVSPNADWGYDVAGYCDVDPTLGTLADLDELVAEAAKRNLKVILDLVPNHTSDQHPWFLDARSSRGSRHRDWYVWADPKPDCSPPNNWLSSFGGPAWTLDEATGQYYLHNFLPQQPDLNWWNEEVRTEFDRILRFWFDRGIAGFRIDVVHMVVKDRELRDNPPTTPDDHWFVQLRGQRQTYNSCRPEVHDVIRRWRRVADSYDPPRILVGETHVFGTDELVSFYGANDELNLAFNFPFLFSEFGLGALRDVVEATEAALPAGAWPVWTAGNHDTYRFPTRWGGNDDRRTRCALMMLLTLRGTPFLYYGDELGMADTDVPVEQLRDPVGIAMHPIYGRDPERTPMPWHGRDGAGFTAPGVTPWLPFGDIAARNVEDQRHDHGSNLSLVRDLIGLRAAIPQLRHGSYQRVEGPDGVWAWRRGERVVVAINGSDEAAVMGGIDGRIRVGTRRARDTERVDGRLVLESWEGVVVWLDAPA